MNVLFIAYPPIGTALSASTDHTGDPSAVLSDFRKRLKSGGSAHPKGEILTVRTVASEQEANVDDRKHVRRRIKSDCFGGAQVGVAWTFSLPSGKPIFGEGMVIGVEVQAPTAARVSGQVMTTTHLGRSGKSGSMKKLAAATTTVITPLMMKAHRHPASP